MATSVTGSREPSSSAIVGINGIDGNGTNQPMPLKDSDTAFHVGSRNSKLALVQTDLVINQLLNRFPQYSFDVRSMATTGDKVLDVALSKIGAKALFTKELELALHAGTADLVVHSLKDVPTTLPKGMLLAAVLEREDPRDCVVLSDAIKRDSPHITRLEDLPDGAVIGTSSVRRCAQMKRKFPNLVFRDVRGNVLTRLSKLNTPSSDPAFPAFSALLLARSGLLRLDLQSVISYTLEDTESLYAVGQGALAVECRDPAGGTTLSGILAASGDSSVELDGLAAETNDRDPNRDARTVSIISSLEHRPTRVRVECERQIMRRLEGGCSVPLGVRTNIIAGADGGRVLRVIAAVWTLDGVEEVRAEGEAVLADVSEAVEGYPDEAFTRDVKSAKKLADQIVEKIETGGGKIILDQIKARRERGELVVEDVSKRPKKVTSPE
ncbi:hypothetical protein HDU93_010083 [Gonapodya sp. JEL0774]|nr:hypothetical protein HDU93_010083 [Gonapodya sp. JEL0774]